MIPDFPNPLVSNKSQSYSTDKVIPPVKKASDRSSKTVLLVDADLQSGEVRAVAMRAMGITVRRVCSARAARLDFATQPYNLVLLHLPDRHQDAEELAKEFRSRKPGQLVAFLVGKPTLIATSLMPAKEKLRHGIVAINEQRSTRGPSLRNNIKSDFGRKIRAAEAQQQEQLNEIRNNRS